MKVYEDAHGYRHHDHDAFDRAAELRERYGSELLICAEAISAFRGGPLERLGRVNDVERQAELVREALVAEARAVGYSWAEIAAALELRERRVRRRYGDAVSR